MAQLEADSRWLQDEMARLVQQEAGINMKLKLVKKQKSAVDQNKLKESFLMSVALREAS